MVTLESEIIHYISTYTVHSVAFGLYLNRFQCTFSGTIDPYQEDHVVFESQQGSI